MKVNLFGLVTSILVSSANNIGMDLSFIVLGKSFMKIRNMGPKLIPVELHASFLPMQKNLCG